MPSRARNSQRQEQLCLTKGGCEKRGVNTWTTRIRDVKQSGDLKGRGAVFPGLVPAYRARRATEDADLVAAAMDFRDAPAYAHSGSAFFCLSSSAASAASSSVTSLLGRPWRTERPLTSYRPRSFLTADVLATGAL